MTLIREHRGSLADSMHTVRECRDRAHLLEIITAEPFFDAVKDDQVHVKPYSRKSGCVTIRRESLTRVVYVRPADRLEHTSNHRRRIRRLGHGERPDRSRRRFSETGHFPKKRNLRETLADT